MGIIGASTGASRGAAGCPSGPGSCGTCARRCCGQRYRRHVHHRWRPACTRHQAASARAASCLGRLLSADAVNNQCHSTPTIQNLPSGRVGMSTLCLTPKPAQLQVHPHGTELLLRSTVLGDTDRTRRLTKYGATVERRRVPSPTRLYAGMYSRGCWHRLGKGSGGSSGGPRSGSRARLGAPCPAPSIAASAAAYATASAGLPSNGLCCAAPAGSCARCRLTIC